MDNNALLKLSNKKNTLVDFFVGFIFVLYFANDLFRVAFTYFFHSIKYFYPFFTIVFLTCIVLYALLVSARNLRPAFVCFCIIALIFGVTYLIHPEYKSWFFDQTYGIQIQFFRCTGGIWAFWAVSMVPERKDLYRYLRWASFLIIITQTYMFWSVQHRGYWISYDQNLNMVQSKYNLGFGYDVLFPLLFFAGEAVLARKKPYYLLLAFCAILILLGGSRGPLIWVILIFPAMMLYRYQFASSRNKVIMVLLIMALLPLAVIIYLFFDDILQMMMTVISRLGFSSQTLYRIISNNAVDLNGRETIYAIVWNLIKTGGPFGRGAFGERLAVGKYYKWGYAHNFFLEIYCAFGYVGGTAICAVLLSGIIKTARRLKEPMCQIVFLTFLFGAMKLMLSDSFWFNASFWGLLALLWMWRNQDRVIEKRRKILKWGT